MKSLKVNVIVITVNRPKIQIENDDHISFHVYLKVLVDMKASVDESIITYTNGMQGDLLDDIC